MTKHFVLLYFKFVLIIIIWQSLQKMQNFRFFLSFIKINFKTLNSFLINFRNYIYMMDYMYWILRSKRKKPFNKKKKLPTFFEMIVFLEPRTIIHIHINIYINIQVKMKQFYKINQTLWPYPSSSLLPLHP